MAAMTSDGRVVANVGPTTWDLAPYRATVSEPSATAGADLMAAVDQLRTRRPRVAVIRLNDGQQNVASVWTRAAAARLQRCGLDRTELGRLFGVIEQKVGILEHPSSAQDADESIRTLGEIYWIPSARRPISNRQDCNRGQSPVTTLAR